jgi:cell cycle sensor histidine kinase DivJ
MGKPFVQYDSSSTRATQGAGLGLTLAVGLVEIQGGSIEFSKREGGGTVATTVLNVPPPKSRRSS